MIHHEHRCIFIHINKTAGTSVGDALGMLQTHVSAKMVFSEDILDDDQNRWWQDWLKTKKQNEFNWIPLDEVKNYWEDYYKFTIVRNPWDRIVSDFSFCKKKKFVSDDYTIRDEVTENLDNYERWKQPCYDWIEYENKNSMDFVLRFENLQNDFDQLCKNLGIQTKTLPHINPTNHKHYTEYFDDETKSLVAEKYAKDIEYFGYEFGQ